MSKTLGRLAQHAIFFSPSNVPHNLSSSSFLDDALIKEIFTKPCAIRLRSSIFSIKTPLKHSVCFFLLSLNSPQPANDLFISALFSTMSMCPRIWLHPVGDELAQIFPRLPARLPFKKSVVYFSIIPIGAP